MTRTFDRVIPSAYGGLPLRPTAQPSRSRFEQTRAHSQLERLPVAADAAAGDRGVSLYVHVPFCAARCAYCDFHSHALPRTRAAPRWAVAEDGSYLDPVDEYLAALGAELEAAAPVLGDVPTIYLGGGTPSALRERLTEVLDRVREHARPAEDAEVTVEANPESTDVLLAAAMALSGVTRASLGVQAFDDDVLRVLGRRHDARRARSAASDIRREGIALAVDLMCGVPRQTAASWRDTVERAVETGAEHVSVYPLTIEEGTPLASAVRSGTVPAPDPDAAADMMLAAEETLAAAGLRRYEVANYARPGRESRHNLRYWTGGEYVGLGPSAASMLSPRRLALVRGLGPSTLAALDASAGQETARVRFTANRTFDGFVREGFGRAADEAERLSVAEAAREDVMLGLRLTRGVAEELALSAGPAVVAALDGLEEHGLVERVSVTSTGGRAWRMTQRGWLLGNEVFGAVWNAGGG